MAEKNSSCSLKNQFLISMPHMRDSGFAKTLTYICEHDEQGAMGLVINRPTEISLGEMFEQLNINVSDSELNKERIFAGGPVQTDRGFILHKSNQNWDSTIKVADNISLTTSRDILSHLADTKDPYSCLVALGYSGWGAGQLEEEITNNYWLTVPATSDIIFDLPYDQRLNAAAARLGISLEQISTQSGHA
jgi:putative transcriptional regulator